MNALRSPERVWNEQQKPEEYAQSSFRMPALMAGATDQVLDEALEGVQFVQFAYQVVRQPKETYEGVWGSIKDLKWQDIQHLALERFENYELGGDVASHQGGKDAVEVTMIAIGGVKSLLKIKDIKENPAEGIVENAAKAKELAKAAAKKADDVLASLSPAVRKRVEDIADETVRRRLLDDLVNDPEGLYKAIDKRPELVESWKVLGDHPILRKKPENLGKINKWLDEGIELQKLTDGIAKSPSKQNLIDQLGTAKSKVHAQVLIKDYDNIPGVVKGRYTPNGSSLSDKLDLPKNWADDVNLPQNQIRNFTGKIEPLELKPGDKIYRVSHADGASGPYWTRTKPEKLEDVVGGTAVLPEWNNFQYLHEYTIPDGVTIKSWKGKTARQPVSYQPGGSPLPSNYYLPGGEEQIYISFIGKQDSNFGVAVKSRKISW